MERSGLMKLDASLEQVSTALEYLMQELARLARAEDCDAIELGMAEILSNVVRHGYHGGAGPIRIHWSARPGRIELRIADTGSAIPSTAFDEAASTVFDFENTSVGDLPERGMGLALAHRSFHKLRYRSRSGVNRLVAVRRVR